MTPTASLTASRTTPQQAAKALASLTMCSGLPPLRHYEVALTDDSWSIHVEVDASTADDAARLMAKLATDLDVDFHRTSDRVLTLDIVHDDVPVRLWYLKPIERWSKVPESCATCPKPLTAGVQHIRLASASGVEQDSVVICVACRDQMHQAWAARSAG